jgi:hypothetical protein
MIADRLHDLADLVERSPDGLRADAMPHLAAVLRDLAYAAAEREAAVVPPHLKRPSLPGIRPRLAVHEGGRR